MQHLFEDFWAHLLVQYTSRLRFSLVERLAEHCFEREVVLLTHWALPSPKVLCNRSTSSPSSTASKTWRKSALDTCVAFWKNNTMLLKCLLSFCHTLFLKSTLKRWRESASVSLLSTGTVWPDIAWAVLGTKWSQVVKVFSNKSTIVHPEFICVSWFHCKYFFFTFCLLRWLKLQNSLTSVTCVLKRYSYDIICGLVQM